MIIFVAVKKQNNMTSILSIGISSRVNFLDYTSRNNFTLLLKSI